MELGSLLFLLIFLACPLMMIFMMRGHGGHASHGTGAGSMHGRTEGAEHASIGELRRRRTELDAEITELEESETKTPVAV